MNLPTEDFTERMDPNYSIEVETQFYGTVKARLTRALRIGDCIRGSFEFVIFNHGAKPVRNHFDQWFFPRNVGENCELQPISYEQAQALNQKVAAFLSRP